MRGELISIFQYLSFSFGIFSSGLESWLPQQTAEVDIFVQRTLLVAAADDEGEGEGEVNDDEADDDDEIGGAGGAAAARGAAGGRLWRVLLARTLVVVVVSLQVEIITVASSSSVPSTHPVQQLGVSGELTASCFSRSDEEDGEDDEGESPDPGATHRQPHCEETELSCVSPLLSEREITE